MSSVWTVKPETKQVDLVWVDPNGVSRPFWVTLKKRLTSGEARAARMAGWRGLREDGSAPPPQPDAAAAAAEPQIAIDWKERTRGRTEAWLVDWSLTDDQGGRLDSRSREVLDSLDDEVFELIDDAIVAHIKSLLEEKKRPSTSNELLTKSA